MKKKNSKELQNEVLNASIVDNSISDDLICGSGLFNWNSSIKKDVYLYSSAGEKTLCITAANISSY